jgi:hypothetical protein
MFSFSPELHSGSLRSPPLRSGEKEQRTTTANNQRQSTKFISGLDHLREKGFYVMICGMSVAELPIQIDREKVAEFCRA